jgi:predicted ester cyclase
VYFEVFNGGNLEAVDDFIDPEHENHDPTAPDVPTGPEGVHEEIVVAGDRVAHRWTFEGTHRDEIMGFEPTETAVTVHGIEINRIADGKITESGAISDALGMLRQLGVELPE